MVDCCMTEFRYFLQCTARRQRLVEDWCKFVNGLAFHRRMVNCKCSNPPNRSTYRRLFSMAKEKEKLEKKSCVFIFKLFSVVCLVKELDGYFKKCFSNYSHSRTEYKYNPKGKKAINIRSQTSQLYRRYFFPKLEVRWNLQWKIMIFESKFAKKRKVRMKEARYVHWDEPIWWVIN